jgi:aspartate-semialdehyde dehydrogenase
MKIAVVGATGMVGKKVLEVLSERNIAIDKLIPVASERNVGNTVLFNGIDESIVDIEMALSMKPDIAIFSAGKSISLEYAPKFAQNGTFVIDNSSAWRMHNDIKLVVPEINADLLTKEDKIIANPNCSTIQMVMVLFPLHKLYGLKRVVVSTYQSVTGSGFKGYNQLMKEREGNDCFDAYPHPIDLNCLPHGGNFFENGYTEEEMKLVNETRKILDISDLGVSATVVRVPVIGGHSMSVNVEFFNELEVSDIRTLLSEFPNILVKDMPQNNIYPMPIWSHHKDEVFVGRIRLDETQANTVNMWIVADNLRKGAATNAVQIAQYLIRQNLV